MSDNKRDQSTNNNKDLFELKEVDNYSGSDYGVDSVVGRYIDMAKWHNSIKDEWIQAEVNRRPSMVGWDDQERARYFRNLYFKMDVPTLRMKRIKKQQKKSDAEFSRSIFKELDDYFNEDLTKYFSVDLFLKELGL